LIHVEILVLTKCKFNVSSTLQIQKHEYFDGLNIVIFVDIYILPFYAINMDVVSLFADSSFLFLEILNLY